MANLREEEAAEAEDEEEAEDVFKALEELGCVKRQRGDY